VGRVSPLELARRSAAVRYRVSGEDEVRVRDDCARGGGPDAGHESLRRINFDWMEPARVVRIEINQDQARLLNLSNRRRGRGDQCPRSRA